MSFTDRFTTRADAYAASRPSYPSEAIDSVLEGLGDPAKLVIADIGAGTGISSRLLADRGAKVFAIEPNASMRAAAEAHPRMEWVAGTAEKTTLSDHSVDLVTAFQAWHWVDPPLATAEVRRILRAGAHARGRLAVVYNERDERDEFTAKYGHIVRSHATDGTEARRANALAHALGIDPAETTRDEFHNQQTLTRAGVHARAESTSYLPQKGAAAVALHAEIDALLDSFSQSADKDAFTMCLVTIVSRVTLASQP